MTDATSRTRRDLSYNELVPRMSIYQAGVEDRDLSLAHGWTTPGYDDGGWVATRRCGCRRCAVDGVGRATVAAADRARAADEAALGAAGAVSGSRPHDRTRALRESWATGAEISQRIWDNEFGENGTEAEMTKRNRDREFEGRKAVVEIGDGGWYGVSLERSEAVTWVFDLGRGYTCLGRAEVEGATGGEQLVISYSEKLAGDGPYLSDPETYCRVRMTDRYRLATGDQQVEPFWMRGGRILIFQVVGPTGPAFRIRFGARAAEYPLEITRPVSSDDPC